MKKLALLLTATLTTALQAGKAQNIVNDDGDIIGQLQNSADVGTEFYNMMRGLEIEQRLEQRLREQQAQQRSLNGVEEYT